MEISNIKTYGNYLILWSLSYGNNFITGMGDCHMQLSLMMEWQLSVVDAAHKDNVFLN